MSEPDEQDDLLGAAFEALRDETKAPSPKAAATRRAILVAATRARRRRTVVVRLVLPLAAALAVSTAWAAATGRLPRFLSAAREISSAPADVGTVAVIAPSGGEVVDASAPVVAAGSSDDADAGPLVGDVPVVVSSAVSAPPVRHAPSGARAGSERAAHVATDAAPDPEQALYQSAHDAHFAERDWARALVAWDAYLAAHPTGRFAPEARYNRALTLVRLGRRDEARAALRPFARGDTFGGYRQKEAKALLDAME